MSRYSPNRIDRFYGQSRVYLTIISTLLYAGLLVPNDADADLISVLNVSPDANVGGSEMFLRHQEGGRLGWDGLSGGDIRWSTILSDPDNRPPGMGVNDNWLWIYSDQVNQHHDVSDYELQRDSRPFDIDEQGPEEFNQPFPLVLDTQGPNSITSSDNFVRFELQAGPDVDQGRQFYNWTMTLDFNAGASWADGFSGSTRSGSIDWVALGGQGATTDLPAYNLTDTQGQYATLLVTPIPEPSSVLLLLLGAGGVFVARRLRSRKLLG